MFNIFKRKSPVEKYNTAKKDLDEYEDILSRFDSVSDNQISKIVKLRKQLRCLKVYSNSVVHLRKKGTRK